jgi:hypothetical protein
MARQRSQIGLRPVLIAAARNRIRMGASHADTVSLLAAEFNTAHLNQIRSIVDREERIWETTRALLRYNRGQFVNPGRLAGCTPGAQSLSVRIVLHYEDAVTQQPSSFGHTVVMSQSGRWGELIDTAIAQVAALAADRHYQIPTIRSGDRSGSVRYEIAAAECI